jgi:hypothetical protein
MRKHGDEGMKFKTTFLCASLGFLASAGCMRNAHAADLFGPRPGDMTSYETPEFTLVTIDNLQLRRDLKKLPKLKRAMELALGTEARPTGMPTYVYVVSNQIWAEYLRPSDGIIGEFVPARFANYIVANGAQINRGGVFHEFVHLFVHTQLDGIYPLWFDEGLAEMFSNGEYAGTTVRLFPRGSGITPNWLPVEDVLRATRTSPAYLDRVQTGLFHFQSRLMVQRALVDDPEFGKQAFQYLRAINDLEPIESAVSTSFGLSLHALDSQSRGYAQKTYKQYARFKIEDVKELKIDSGRPLSRLDSLLAIATVSLDTGLGLERTHELLDAAAALPGGEASARPLRLRLAARRFDDAALDRLYEELVPRLGDAGIARVAGLALFERIMTLGEREATPARSRLWLSRSFELLDRSLAANSDDAEATWAFATLAGAVKRDIPKALERLEPALVKWTRSPDLAAAASLLHEALGNTSQERECLIAVYKHADDFDRKRWAARRIAELDAKTPAKKP